MTFGEWQQLAPEAAAREVRRRAEARLSPAQRRAALAVLLDEASLTAGFALTHAGSPLHGIPYLLKDLFDAAGLPTFAGSSFLPEVRPSAGDARIVKDLRDAGAVLAGKTHLFEFAWGLTGENAHYGDCEHPGFPGRTSGGSSSGSAAAVAADVVPLAVGTDTGGSLRVPAAFCGIFSYRGVPRDPWISDAVPLAPSLDTAGWFTRTAGDMRLALAALVGIRTSDRALRGCYLDAMPGVEPEVASACRAAASAFAPPADAATRDELLDKFASGAEIYGVIAGVEGWKLQRKWAVKHRARYGPLLLDRLDRASTISQAQVAAVEPSFAALKLAWAKFFLAHDFLVMPATPFPALAKADCTPANRLRMLGLTAPASLGGLPVLTIPVALPSGMTSGLQVIMNHPQSPVVPWALALAEAAS